MGELKHVVLTAEVYEELLGYLSETQVYKNVAQLISKVVNDANKNSQALAIVSNVTKDEAKPEATSPAKLSIVEGEKE